MSTVAMLAGLLGWIGLALSLAALRRAGGRLERVACAEHELRGPIAVLALTRERMEREPTGRRYARALEVELERLTAALADLTAARTGRRRVAMRLTRGRSSDLRASAGEVCLTRGRSSDLRAFAGGALAGWAPALRAAGRRTRFDWKAGRVALPGDRGRVAQVLGNLVANAAEHGAGEVEVRGRRVPGGVRVEVRNGLREESARRRAPSGGRGLPIAVDAARQLGGSIVTDRGARSFRAALELPLSEASLRVRERSAGAAARKGRSLPSSGAGPASPPGRRPVASPGSRPASPARPEAVPPRGSPAPWSRVGARAAKRAAPLRPPRPPAHPRPPQPPRRVIGNRRRM